MSRRPIAPIDIAPKKRPRALLGRVQARALEAERIEAVLARAEEIGLTAAKDGRISGRVSVALVERAKARTGLAGDTELIEFALASLALDDDFLAAFDTVAGTVDPGLDLDS